MLGVEPQVLVILTGAVLMSQVTASSRKSPALL
jgi:hypothetical protein